MWTSGYASLDEGDAREEHARLVADARRHFAELDDEAA